MRQASGAPPRVDGLLERAVVVGLGQDGLVGDVGEQLQHRARQELHLLLLNDHRHELPARTRLQVERAHPRLTHGVRGDAIDDPEVHGAYPRSFRPLRVAGVSHGRRRGLAEAPEPAGVVHEHDVGARPAQLQDRDRGRIDHDPLELVQRGRRVVGEHDPSDIAVRRDHHPAVAMAPRDPFQPTHRAGLRVGEGLAAAREREGAGRLLHRAPRLETAELPERASGPRARVHLEQGRVVATASRRAAPSGSTVCTQRSSGLL